MDRVWVQRRAQADRSILSISITAKGARCRRDGAYECENNPSRFTPVEENGKPLK